MLSYDEFVNEQNEGWLEQKLLQVEEMEIAKALAEGFYYRNESPLLN